MIYYTLPSLVSLSLDKILSTGIKRMYQVSQKGRLSQQGTFFSGTPYNLIKKLLIFIVGCPPASEIKPLPPHLKDPLRKVLLKRGTITGANLICWPFPHFRWAFWYCRSWAKLSHSPRCDGNGSWRHLYLVLPFGGRGILCKLEVPNCTFFTFPR